MTEPTTTHRMTDAVSSSADTGSTPVPHGNRSSLPAYSARRLLCEQSYRVGRSRVTIRLWRLDPAVHPDDPTRDHRPLYVLEMTAGGTRSAALIGYDHAAAIELCERLTRARLSPIHLSDILEDEACPVDLPE